MFLFFSVVILVKLTSLNWLAISTVYLKDGKRNGTCLVNKAIGICTINQRREVMRDRND
jgi:hypothetical protein